jgi:hypothetical protein
MRRRASSSSIQLGLAEALFRVCGTAKDGDLALSGPVDLGFNVEQDLVPN